MTSTAQPAQRSRGRRGTAVLLLCVALAVASAVAQSPGAALSSSLRQHATGSAEALGATWWEWIKRVLHIAPWGDQAPTDPTPTYSEATAVYLARVTSVAYCGANHIRNWSCSPCALVDPLSEIHVVEDGKGSFQGLVGYNQLQNQVLVAFRGSMDVTNWIDNLTFLKKQAYIQYPHVRVHRGFYWVFQSVRDEVVAAVNELLGAHPTASVVVTGHSLGGAAAALCGFELALIQNIPVAALYTFGEPRVGNSNFSSLINQAIPQVYRVTHYRDVVPHLPPSWIGFQHSAQEVYYDEFASSFRVCDPRDGEDPRCSNACSPFGCTSVVDHLTYVNVTMSHLVC